MKVIIFGGSGFVGSHVADALTETGHEVTIFDQYDSPYLKPNQSFLQGNILDFESVKAAVLGQDIVYNFAGMSDLDDALDKSRDTVLLNILGCVNLLEAARLSSVQRFVFASTIYVYSESGGFYRVSKQACEIYIEEYLRRYGLHYTILRYGTLYGRRADDRNSVHRYLKQAFFDRCIRVAGSGNEIREYIHVVDAARMSVQILNGEYCDQNVILTGHHPMRFKDLLLMIGEIIGPDVRIEFSPLEENANIHGHYNLTPYSFHPKIGKKLVNQYYLDMGQGLLDCLDEINMNNLEDQI